MNIILVNASAAKTGGAETIVRTFLKNIPDDKNNKYYIFAPFKVNMDIDNVFFKYKKTSGIKTIWFSFIGILYWLIKLKSKKIISFNNINCFLYTKYGITYFHQPKALDNSFNEKKVVIYRFLIKNFLNKNHFIVQSNYVKELFDNKFTKARKVTSCWPGFLSPRIVKNTSFTDFIDEKINISKHYKIGLLPIAYAGSHKNVESLKKNILFFKKENIKIITLLKEGVLLDESVFINLGSINRDDLFYLYSKVDFLVFTSTAETVGLPIFEFMNTGKPAFVLKAPYIIDFFKYFKRPKNLIIYNNSKHFISLYIEKNNIFSKINDYSQGEWNKIFKEINETDTTIL